MNLRRKRMILMRDVWYGYNRTASGNPVKLDAAKRLRQLTIYGNAVQDGTPSPDAPVDIQLCGDATGNLFDKSNATLGYRLYQDGQPYPQDEGNEQFISDYISVEGDTQYYYNATTNWDTRLCEYDINKSLLVQHDQSYNAFTDIFTTSENTAYVRFTRPQSQMDMTMISKSSEAQPYEPYGYKVSGRVEGVNLLSSEWEQGDISPSTGVNTNSSKRIRTVDYINVLPSTIYTVYGCDYYVVIAREYDAEKKLIRTSSVNNSNFLRFTTNAETQYIRLVIENNVDNVFPDMTLPYTLLKGFYTADTIPPYEPYQPPQDFAVYLPQQIAKVGDAADTVVIDFEQRTAELVQNIRRYDFTGSETIITQEDTAYPGGKRFIVQRLALALEAKRYTVTCNRFKQHAYMNNTDNTIFAHNNDFFIYYSAMDTTDDFKAFLAANPTYAYVQYATPVTTDITAMQDWDAMPQVKGTVTLTLSAEVEPSGAEAVYYSAERGD